MTRTLAFDTSQQWCSVAVSINGTVRAHSSELVPEGHTQLLLPKILNTLQQADVDIKNIDLISTITGPGSFTGLRVSIATAQGLGLALSKPVIGIDTFTAYANCISTQTNILVVIDSQKQDVYCQLFSPQQTPLKEAIAIDPSQITSYAGQESFTLTGTAATKVSPFLDEKGLIYDMHHITADEICQNLSLKTHTPEYATSTIIQPFYLKEAMARKPAKA